MGANIVGKVVALDEDIKYITAACCIQPPLRMWLCKETIEKSFFGVYNKALA